MSKPWKKLPCEHREALLKMPNAALKVWLAHYLRSGREDSVEMSNSQLARECDLNEQTVKIAKKWLKENGGLNFLKETYRDERNQFVIPTVKVEFPTRVENPPSDPGLKTHPGTRVEFPPDGKPTHIVAPMFSAPPQTLLVNAPPSTKDVDVVAKAVVTAVVTAVAQGAAASAAWRLQNLKELETEILDYWYQVRLKRSIDQMDEARIQQDLPFVKELISTVNGNSRNLLRFVFTDPGEGEWAGWDKKTPNLPALIKHVRKGDILVQFAGWLDTDAQFAAQLENGSAFPTSPWEAACRAPGCTRAWTVEKWGIKMCDICAGLKEAPPKIEGPPSCPHCGSVYWQSYGFGPNEWMRTCSCEDDMEVVVDEL